MGFCVNHEQVYNQWIDWEDLDEKETEWRNLSLLETLSLIGMIRKRNRIAG